jgi:hypothetical protein
MIKSRRMRWAGRVARIKEKRNVYRLLVGKLEGKIPLGRPRRRWVYNIKMDLLKICRVVWTGLVWLRIGTSGELCECSNEISSSITYSEIMQWLHSWWPLERCSAP